MNQPILTHTHNRIGYITLNRADKRNALNSDMVFEMKKALTAMAEDKEVKVVVIKAEGTAFCAGADLGYLQQLQSNTYDENLEDSRNLKDLFYQIYTFPKVVIAQIQGHALAGGCGLATVCDFSFAVDHAKFGYTEVKIGFIPAIVKVFLLRKIGEGKAKQLLLDGDLISAQEAKDMGLINWVVAADDLEEKVTTYAYKLIHQNSGQSMRLTKEMIALVQEKSLEDGLDYAAQMNAHARATGDCQKGIASFLNKEKLSW
ncbi:enoyl-CoA hydratase/isomerase family protein [Mongoliitalea daihaiensis]|uniref:enoyl-CoA hydratase/isomerase family protein n=1 Tax=Mongoliitalea daihaiensis TaxID=2782006 RepID=UPI001F33CAE5|nr:enoyl-CoA hydratase-related protein [Mongoliitalea daihaiensis]UJP66673.1 enoyl-CoA hydratase/isomerase family protein [Mongoliitalea daihaiensis]